MKKFTKPQLLQQKLLQTWSNWKHYIWSLIAVAVPIFIAAEVIPAVVEYYETGTVTLSRSIIISVLCMPFMTYDIWQRFFAEPGEKMIVQFSVQGDSNSRKYLAIQIGQVSYNLRIPMWLFVLCVIVSFVRPDLAMITISAVSFTLSCVSTIVVGLLLVPFVLVDTIMCISEEIPRKPKKVR